MKKKVCFAAAALLLGALVLSGCGGMGKLAEENPLRGVTSSALSALDGYTVTAFDGEGLVSAEKEGTYALYDVRAQSLVTADAPFIPAGGSGSGMYYTAETSGGTYTYVFYDGTEEVCTVTQAEEFTYSGGVYTFADGTILYKGLDGEVYRGARQGIDPIPTRANTAEAGGCYLLPLGADEGSVYAVYDGRGRLVRTVSPAQAFASVLPADAETSALWPTETKLFIQARIALPDDAGEYDLIAEGQRYDVPVYSFDLLTGAVKEIGGFGYLVNGTEAAGENYAVLRVQQIFGENRLSAAEVVQCFGEDGGIFVDLQALLPGATGFSAAGGYAALSDGVQTAYFRGGEHLVTLSPASDASWMGAGWLRRSSDPCEVLNSSGEKVLEMAEGSSVLECGERYIYYSEPNAETGIPAVYVFDASSGGTARLEGYEAAASGFYIAENAAGVRTLYSHLSAAPVAENIAEGALVSALSAPFENERLYVVSVAEGASVRSVLVRSEYEKEL